MIAPMMKFINMNIMTIAMNFALKEVILQKIIYIYVRIIKKNVLENILLYIKIIEVVLKNVIVKIFLTIYAQSTNIIN